MKHVVLLCLLLSDSINSFAASGAEKLTRRSADADKPALRVYNEYGFLLVFYINFSPTRTVFEIFAFSNTVTLKSGSKVT